jgi:hypothetical protein
MRSSKINNRKNRCLTLIIESLWKENWQAKSSIRRRYVQEAIDAEFERYGGQARQQGREIRREIHTLSPDLLPPAPNHRVGTNNENKSMYYMEEA